MLRIIPHSPPSLATEMTGLLDIASFVYIHPHLMALEELQTEKNTRRHLSYVVNNESWLLNIITFSRTPLFLSYITSTQQER